MIKEIIYIGLPGLFYVSIPISFAVYGQDKDFQYNPKTYICHKIDTQLTMDGKLDEESWKNTPWTDYFVNIKGAQNPAPPYKTKVKMLWDKKYFYVGAKLEDHHLWATLQKRDAVIFMENCFEVFIDPDGDTHNYCEFQINALGAYWDLFLAKPYINGGEPIHTWNIKKLKVGIELKGTLNNPQDKDEGWYIELGFPWKSFKKIAFKKSKPNNGDQWRINFSRVDWKIENQNGKYMKTINVKTGLPFRESYSVWSPQGIVNLHSPELWGFVQFSNKKPGTQVAFSPNPDDGIKWFLRTLYNAEKKYFQNHHSFTNVIDTLSLNLSLTQNIQRLKINTTANSFEITYPSHTPGYQWHIRNDGKIWKTRSKPKINPSAN